jgi:hypothetical protein
MHAALPFTFEMSDMLTNVGQVLKNKGATRDSALHEAFREDMIMVTSQAKLFLVQLAQVAFSRTSAFALKFPFEAKDTAFLREEVNPSLSIPKKGRPTSSSGFCINAISNLTCSTSIRLMGAHRR